ncbi:MAG: DUF945 domain-containing protein [Desulfobacteraceae bacterium]|nr:DUF945 domain-containing protein [Desulfobacteraceae bacterium]
MRFSFYRSKARAHSPLTNDQIIELSPAAGALKPHSSVSDRYSFVPTIQAVDLVRSTGWVPVHAMEAKTRKEEREGFQKHIIRFQMQGLELNSGAERVDLVMYNSHDRGCAFQLLASIWRKICGNGLMVSSKLFNFAHKHINFDAAAFVESAYKIADGAKQIGAQVNSFKEIELSPDERGVFAQSAHQLVYDVPDQSPIKAEQLLKERRYDDKGKDLWSTFNVIQENIKKGGIRGVKRSKDGFPRRTTTRPIKSLDKDIRLNKALWVLTEAMAHLKTN